MKLNRGDTVLVKAAPRSYRAIVEWVDRSFSGDPVKAKVRPISDNVSARARNIYPKNILEVLDSKHEYP